LRLESIKSAAIDDAALDRCHCRDPAYRRPRMAAAVSERGKRRSVYERGSMDVLHVVGIPENETS